MELVAVQCPFTPQQMVMVLTLDAGNEAIGVALMESLAPAERQELFAACAWCRDHQEWDRKSYTEQSGDPFDKQTTH